jgi:NAD(P)H dehydrogenase (quinone)
MSKAKILVTGASGNTGRAITKQLLAAGHPVRAVVHSRDARSEALARLGAEIAVADLFDAGSLTEAARGTQRAYYLPPYHPRMLESAVAFATAARETKLEVVVGMSQWTASPTHPALLSRHHWLADRMFESLRDVGYVRLEPGYFADNTLRLIPFAAHLGILPNLTGDSRNAPPSNEDIARVAAAILASPERHVGKRYRPTGPALLSTADVAGVLSRVVGRRVRPVPMPMWLFAKAARMQGVDAFTLSALRHYVEDHKQGAFERGAPNDVVADVTGAPAEPFEDTARRYAALPQARRGWWPTLRAALDFMRTPLSPGYDLAAVDRAFPRPLEVHLSMHDPGWMRSHAA